jgi:hypothetical protein
MYAYALSRFPGSPGFRRRRYSVEVAPSPSPTPAPATREPVSSPAVSESPIPLPSPSAVCDSVYCAIKDLTAEVANPWPDFWLTVLATVIGAAIAALMAWWFSIDLAKRAEAKRAQERDEDHATAIRRQWGKLSGSLAELGVATSSLALVRLSTALPDKDAEILSALRDLRESLREVMADIADAFALARPDEVDTVLEFSQLVADTPAESPRRATRVHIAGSVAGALASGRLPLEAAAKIVRHVRLADDLPEWGDSAATRALLDRFISPDKAKSQSSQASSTGSASAAAAADQVGGPEGT